jgi:Ca-activated chloride channel family protein
MDTKARSRALQTLLAAAALAFAAAPAKAQQLIAWPMGGGPWMHLLPGQPVRPMPLLPMPHPRPMPQPFVPEQSVPVTVSGYAVEGTIRDDAAELTYNIVFHNPTQQRLEGVLLVPIPADAVLSGFQMTVGGKTMKGELLDAGQAATVYENIVRQQRDPGLLELVGERLFRARVFPIEPGADVSVRLALSQILHKNGGLASLTVPVRSAQMTQGQRGAASVALHVHTTHTLRTLYSPDGRLKLSRNGDRAAEATFTAAAGAEDSDVSLFFSTQDDPLAASVLAFREPGEDGYFLVSLSPRAQDAQAQAAPKDVVFVVDRSGSMEENGKMTQARAALSYCVKRLSPQDRFGIVDFATDWNELEPHLLAATKDNKERALRYIERLDAAGGTNIEAGLTEGLRLLTPAPGRLPLVFFMTDGLPTVGQTDITELLKSAQSKNAALKARLFSFGVGSDVNTLFLDKLAQGNRGTGDYVQPGENIEAKVSTLYQKVARPALTDVSLDWQGLDAVQVYPRPVGDLFYGSEMVVMGRYKAGGKGRLVVTGRAGGLAQRFEFPVELPERSSQLAFLPKLWANAKVSHELDLVRLSGRADPEVVQDIVKLAKRYGIVTPYTSYLITEEGRDVRRSNIQAVSAMRGAAFDAANSGFAAPAMVGGGGGTGLSGGSMLDSGMSMRAQKASRLFGAMANAAAAPAASAAMMQEAEAQTRDEVRAKGETLVALKTVADKTFYKRGGEWVDGDLEADGVAPLKTVEVGDLSAEYFQLLSAHPELARYFAIGGPLRLLRDGVLYKVR